MSACRYIFFNLYARATHNMYDTVDRELLWKIMLRHGCPKELIFVLWKLYTDITIELNHIKNQYLPAAMKNKYSKCKSP